MKRAILLLFAFALLAAAQIPTLTISRRPLLDGRVQLTLRNMYKSPVTAYVLGYKKRAAPGVPFQSASHANDNLGSLLIPPDAETSVELSDDPWELQAVIFADGTVQGNYHWIETIVGNWRRALKDIQEALVVLRQNPPDLEERLTKPAEVVSPIATMIRSDLKKGTLVPEMIRKLEALGGQLDRQKL